MPDQDNHTPSLPETVIPWWQDGRTISDAVKEPYYLSKGVTVFFQRVRQWLLFPLRQMDALTCSESLLQLMAWDRDITRFDSEPLLLFRMRVKYALINAKEAGSVAGFTRIFERMGIDIVAFKERVNRAQWDVCIIELTDGDISQNGKLVQTLIEQYGRTCRRYRLHVSFPSTLSIVSGVYAHNAALFSAKDDRLGALTVVPQPVEHIQHIYVAKLGGNA